MSGSFFRRALRYVAATCVVVALLTVFHEPLLRGVFEAFVLDESPEQATTVLIGGGDKCFDVAATWFREDRVERVAILESAPGRLEWIGVVPYWHEVSRRELEKREVPPERILVIPGQPYTRWQAARMVARWLDAHPDQRVAVLTSQLDSRLLDYVYDQELSAEARSRTFVVALRDRRFDQSNWWLSRTGLKSVFGSLFNHIYVRVRGEDPDRKFDINPDVYEEALFAARR